MKQNFEVDTLGDFHARSLDGQINCPHCSGDSMHHVKIDIFDCDEDAPCDMTFSLKTKTFMDFSKPVDNSVVFIKPSAAVKSHIKANGGQDLMHESGDVNGCIRIAVWLRRQPDLKLAITQLLNA